MEIAKVTDLAIEREKHRRAREQACLRMMIERWKNSDDSFRQALVMRKLFAWREESGGAWVLFCEGVKVARLLPKNDPRYADWYDIQVEAGFPDPRGVAVDCDDVAEGRDFLEDWIIDALL
jgi:hypothetical protein